MTEASTALREPWPSLDRQRAGVSFGVWVFLATESLFFSGLFLSYAVYRSLYPDAFRIATRETDLMFGAVNTAILLTSSMIMTVASRAADARLRRVTLWCLTLTALLGIIFLGVKGMEYHEDLTKHLLPGQDFGLIPPQTQIFFTLYWVMTGVHAVHLAVGIAMVGIVALGTWRGVIPLQSGSFEGVSLYWHFVDIIWITLVPLLYLLGRFS